MNEAKIKTINIVVGKEAGGNWFAMAPSVPWLVAEGETQEKAMDEAERVAEGLCGKGQVALEWFFAGKDQ